MPFYFHTPLNNVQSYAVKMCVPYLKLIVMSRSPSCRWACNHGTSV